MDICFHAGHAYEVMFEIEDLDFCALPINTVTTSEFFSYHVF